MATNDCGMPKRVCVAGEKIEGQSFCVDPGDCTTKRIVHLVTTDADCAVLSSRYAEADDLGNLVLPIVPYVGPINRVTCAVQRVQVVDSCPNPQAIPPVIVDAPTCDPVTTIPVQTKAEFTTRVVQEEGTVFNVKFCDPTPDHEVTVACNAAGQKVMVQWDAGVVPPVELSRTNLFTGAVEPAGPLSACDTDQIEIKDLVACLNGVEITGFAVVTDATTPVVTGELWRDPTTGVFGPLPAGAVVGKCVTTKLHLNSVHWCPTGAPASPTLSGFSFDNYPDISVDFNGTTSVADLYLHAIEHGPSQLWGTDGLAFVNPTIPVLWANAQPAVDLFLANAGLPAGSVLVGNDGNGQPIVWYDTAVMSEGDIAWWLGPNVPDNYTNKLKAVTPQNFTAPSTGGTCIEGKAWYDEATGALVRINTLDGVDVTATVAAASLKEGPCPAAKRTERLICAIITGATTPTNVIERVEENSCGSVDVTYWDATKSPMVKVTISSVISGEKCSCCDLIPYLP